MHVALRPMYTPQQLKDLWNSRGILWWKVLELVKNLFNVEEA